MSLHAEIKDVLIKEYAMTESYIIIIEKLLENNNCTMVLVDNRLCFQFGNGPIIKLKDSNCIFNKNILFILGLDYGIIKLDEYEKPKVSYF